MNTGSDAPAAQSSTMTTSMPAAAVDVSDVTSLGRAAIAALADRNTSPRHSSHVSPAHPRSHSHSYPQPHSHSRSQSQSELYYQSHQSQQSQPQQPQQPQQSQQPHQQQNQQSLSSSSSRTSPRPRRGAAEDSINASGVFPPPPFASNRPTSTSLDHHQQQQRGQQREQRSSSPSAARTVPKLAAARRPLPSGAPNNAAPVLSSLHSKPSSRRPSASSASPVLSAAYKERMDEADFNGRDVNSASKSGRDAAGSNGATDAPRDEIIVGSSTSLRVSPTIFLSDREDATMGENNSSASLHPKRKRSTTNSDGNEGQAEHSQGGSRPWTPVPRGRPPNVSQQTHQAGSNGTITIHNSALATIATPGITKIDIPLGYWRESTVPDAKDRHAIVGFIDTLDRLRTRVVQLTRYGAPISTDYEHPSGTGSSWVTFERIVFENHLIGLDHNQIKEYVKIRTEVAGVSETPEERAINEKAAVTEAMRRASIHQASDNQPPPQIAYGVDLPDFAMFPNGSRPEKKRRVTNNYGPALSLENESRPKSTTPPSGNNAEIAPARSPSVFSAIQRSAIDLLPGTRPAKILVGYWRGSSEERIDDKHAVLGILGANDMFRVKVTRQTRDGRPVLGNFPVGAGALWINYDEVEFEQHIRHLSRPEMKEYVRVRQRQIDEGEKAAHRQANEATAVYEAQSRVLKAGGAAQSTLGNAGRVDTISFATAVRLDREAARVAEMNEMLRNQEHAERNGMVYDAVHGGIQRRESTGHAFRQTRRSNMDHQEDATSIAAAAVAAASNRAAGRHSMSDVSGRNEAASNPNAERVERTNSIARREITRMESLQQRNEQRAGVSSNGHGLGCVNANGNVDGNGNGNGNGNGIMNSTTPIVPSQHANGATNGVNGGTNNRQTFDENINRLNKVWVSQEASRLLVDGEDTKFFRGVRYERKPTGPFEGKLVSPGIILSIDGEDYVEYRVLTKPTFF